MNTVLLPQSPITNHVVVDFHVVVYVQANLSWYIKALVGWVGSWLKNEHDFCICDSNACVMYPQCIHESTMTVHASNKHSDPILFVPLPDPKTAVQTIDRGLLQLLVRH
jgi:hypothetical protein